MDINTAPTKGNLLAAKNTLLLARQGYELMDKKRNILIKEIMALVEGAHEAQEELEYILDDAYGCLRHAVLVVGHENIASLGLGVEVEDGLTLRVRSVMGAQLPVVALVCKSIELPPFALMSSDSALDEAYIKFSKVKELIVKLAMIENTAHRLVLNIKKTTKRANALKNITIPKYEMRIKHIQNALEERERDEFMRSKMVKGLKAAD